VPGEVPIITGVRLNIETVTADKTDALWPALYHRLSYDLAFAQLVAQTLTVISYRVLLAWLSRSSLCWNGGTSGTTAASRSDN
jgi:hypothetical protein